MKIKRIFILFFLLALNWTFLIPGVFARSYTLGVKEGEQYNWVVDILDEDEMKKTFGKRGLPFLYLKGVNWEEYNDMNLNILHIEEVIKDGVKYWSINFVLTWFRIDSSTKDLHFNDISYIIQNPNEENYPFGELFCLNPVEDYISETCEGQNNYEVKDNSIIYYASALGIKIEMIYEESTGILYHYSICKDGNIIYGLQLSIPMTTLIPLIGVMFLVLGPPTLIVVIVVIFTLHRKKK